MNNESLDLSWNLGTNSLAIHKRYNKQQMIATEPNIDKKTLFYNIFR